MQIQPITNQPSYRGKVLGRGVLVLKDSHWDVPQGMDRNLCLEIPDNLLNKMRQMVKEKSFDVFISPNKNNPEFLNVDAGDSFEIVEKGIQGRIKVRRDAVEAFPQAIQDAMDIFEGHLADVNAKKKFLSKESV